MKTARPLGWPPIERGSTMHPHVDVEASVQLRLVVADADAVPLPVSLRYCATDPYAVRAVFSGDGMEVEWVFARDLLRSGLTSPVGEGDVHVWPSWGTGRELLMISLTSPDGQAVLEAGAQDVRSFLDRTTAVVPEGEESEHLDLDAALARLLACRSPTRLPRVLRIHTFGGPPGEQLGGRPSHFPAAQLPAVD